MPERVTAFLKAFSGNSNSIARERPGGEAIAFASLPPLPPYALFGACHPLAHEHSVKLSQLAALPMVLLDMAMGREYFLALFIRERLEPNIVWSSSQLDVVRTMVANGLGYTLTNIRPRTDIALDGRRIYRVPLSGVQPPMKIGTATLKELKKTCLVEAFARHCGALISEAYIAGMANSLPPRRRKRR